MFDLTPSERKGALVLLALVALGAIADLVRLDPAPAPPPDERAERSPAGAAAGPSPGAGEPEAAPARPASRLDLNAAGERDLDALPGIGPVLAGRIVAHRRAHGPFRSPEDLLAVPGIGPRLLERLLPRVTVQSARPADEPAPAPAARVAPADRTSRRP